MCGGGGGGGGGDGGGGGGAGGVCVCVFSGAVYEGSIFDLHCHVFTCQLNCTPHHHTITPSHQ